MESVFLGLAVLACPVGMGLMMWWMGKGMRGNRSNGHQAGGSLEELRSEHARLGAEIGQLEERGNGHVAGAGEVRR